MATMPLSVMDLHSTAERDVREGQLLESNSKNSGDNYIESLERQVNVKVQKLEEKRAQGALGGNGRRTICAQRKADVEGGEVRTLLCDAQERGFNVTTARDVECGQ